MAYGEKTSGDYKKCESEIVQLSGGSRQSFNPCKGADGRSGQAPSERLFSFIINSWRVTRRISRSALEVSEKVSDYFLVETLRSGPSYLPPFPLIGSRPTFAHPSERRKATILPAQMSCSRLKDFTTPAVLSM